MKNLVKFSGVICFILGVVVLKLFGTTIAFVFMLSTLAAVVAGSAVLAELAKNERKKTRDLILKDLGGSTMHDYLLRNPDRLALIQRLNPRMQDEILNALDPQDASNVKRLLVKESAST